MSWRNDETVPFEPEDRAEQELERYAQQVRPVPPPDFVDRVMGRVEQAPPPRRGLLGGLLALPGAWHRPLQAVAMIVVLVAGVAGALAAGELLISFRNVGSSPPPSVTPTTMPPSPTPSLSPSPSPEPSDSDSPKASASETSSASERETPEPTETERDTPDPSETPEASDDNSGPGGGGGGDDNSGPGGGGGSDDGSGHR